MVQLKVTPSDSRIKLLAFQYLMVQLKGTFIAGEYAPDHISIPHGTIKRT